MKLTISITLLKILFLIGFNCLAFDDKTKVEFDLALISNDFFVDPAADNCELDVFKNERIKFAYHPGKNEIQIFAGDSLLRAIPHMNAGKKEFSFCWSEGIKGFVNNQFFANKMQFKKVTYSTGSMCVEGTRLKLEEEELTFTTEGIQIKSHLINDTTKVEENRVCFLKILPK